MSQLVNYIHREINLSLRLNFIRLIEFSRPSVAPFDVGKVIPMDGERDDFGEKPEGALLEVFAGTVRVVLPSGRCGKPPPVSMTAW